MIYVLFTCDEWKMKDSMSLVGATTSITKLKKQVKKMIKEGDFEMDDATKKFISDNYSNACDINNDVKYCYIEECENGEF